ncbi:PadR family transcriptional regulator [Thermofilum pendens]|uniref:Transcriptional regulator, PadR-like family n=1 Tax=Thermofilum pendens (strain DSM 2475 / Hrk 5) TaxID=368408 RepID=A1RYA6_THEPD|nr:PadR family transcriptional regulator [Thermofilum pendens]ABL78186.1 transcriptional regulator, PadR-like family [Thermofilum pendens Hrk 5]
MTEADWKVGVAGEMGLTPVREPSLDDFVLLLLYLDGRTPIYGEEIIHFILAIYPFVSLRLSPSLYLPYFEAVSEALRRLEERGFIFRSRQAYRDGERRVVRLTETGSDEARKIFKAFSESWLLMRGVALRRGSEVLGELEALKKTYNGKGLVELARLLASKVEGDGASALNHLEGVSKEWVEYFVYLLKRLSKELKPTSRQVF